MNATNDNSGGPTPDRSTKQVYLVAAFPADRPGEGDRGPVPMSGAAEHVIAVIAIEGDHQRFVWVGDDQGDSVANPAMVAPIQVKLGLPSPYHPESDRMLTGLVRLAPAQLGDGPVDDDLDHLLRELGQSRGPTRHPGVG